MLFRTHRYRFYCLQTLLFALIVGCGVQDYAKEVLRSLVRVWKRPVNVQTIAEGKPVMVRYDGREHTTRHLR